MDHESFDVLGKWELERGPQKLAYDFWWHLGFDTLITSEWGTPNMVKKGVNPEILLSGGYGHKTARLGSAEAASSAGTRSGCRASDGAGTASGARPDPRVRFSGRGGLVERSVRVGLAVVSRQR